MAKHIKHIVFWRMKETANGNDAETNMKIAIERLDAVAAEFPKLLSPTHHKGIFTGAHYWDYVEEMEFESLEALKEWAQFPLHKDLHDFVESIRKERAAVDYEI